MCLKKSSVLKFNLLSCHNLCKKHFFTTVKQCTEKYKNKTHLFWKIMVLMTGQDVDTEIVKNLNLAAKLASLVSLSLYMGKGTIFNADIKRK